MPTMPTDSGPKVSSACASKSRPSERPKSGWGASEFDNRLVRAEEFFQLLTSRQKLERRDDQQLGMRGLLDAGRGIRWLVDENDVRDMCKGCH